jgi:hypothetical protein
MVFNPKSYKILIIVNERTKGYTKVFFNKFDPRNIWSESWESRTLDPNWVYIGMFSKDNNIYVIGGKASDSRVFIFTDGNELINYVCICASIKFNKR